MSRIIDANHAAGDTLSVEVSVFREIVRSFDVQTACSFIRMLSARLDDTGGALQLYSDADADANVSTVLNFLDDVARRLVRPGVRVPSYRVTPGVSPCSPPAT